jgi:hypothetical protein
MERIVDGGWRMEDGGVGERDVTVKGGVCNVDFPYEACLSV